MITALIRTHPGREEITNRAIDSAKSQGCEVIIHHGEKTEGYEFNLYCNILKEQVQDGWFFFLDSDDYILPSAINTIREYLTNPDTPIICQMLRNGKPKPNNAQMAVRMIYRGRIGMPCIILHAKYKHIADFVATEDADYRFIKAISEKLTCKFIKQVVVDAGSRSNGK